MDGWEADLAAVLAEPTHKTGVHCTCVLHLRKKNTELKKMNQVLQDQYAEALEIIRALQQ